MFLGNTIYVRFLLMVTLTTTMRTVVRQIVTELQKTTLLWSRSLTISGTDHMWRTLSVGSAQGGDGGAVGNYNYGVAIDCLYRVEESLSFL